MQTIMLLISELNWSSFVVIHIMASRGQARLRNLMRRLDSVNELPLNNS